MPKFYKQNKKRIDPRYYLEETVDPDEFQDAMNRSELTDVDPGSERPPWADPASTTDPMERAKQLAQQGLEQSQTADAGLLDGALKDGTKVIDVLNMVRQQLNGPDAHATLTLFDQMLKEMGVSLSDPMAPTGSEASSSVADQNAKQPAPIM